MASIASLRSASLNRRDAEDFQRGYYENLLDVGTLQRELQRVYDEDAAGIRALAVGARPLAAHDDEQDYRARPVNVKARFVGAMVRTNRWGCATATTS